MNINPLLSSNIRNFLIVSGLFACMISSSIANAADDGKSAKRAALQLKKMQQEMQSSFEQEKAVLQQKLDEAVKQNKTLEEQVASQADLIKKLSASENATEAKLRNLEVTQKKVSAEKNALDTQQQQIKQQLEATSKSLAELKTQYAQILNELKTNENQRKTQVVNISQTRKALEICQEKNAKLYAFGTDLIQIYEAPNGLARLKDKSDFFKSRSVELENILQDQQDKLDMERLSISD